MYNIGRNYSITDSISIFCIDDEYCSFVLENDTSYPIVDLTIVPENWLVLVPEPIY